MAGFCDFDDVCLVPAFLLRQLYRLPIGLQLRCHLSSPPARETPIEIEVIPKAGLANQPFPQTGALFSAMVG